MKSLKAMILKTEKEYQKNITVFTFFPKHLALGPITNKILGRSSYHDQLQAQFQSFME